MESSCGQWTPFSNRNFLLGSSRLNRNIHPLSVSFPRIKEIFKFYIETVSHRYTGWTHRTGNSQDSCVPRLEPVAVYMIRNTHTQSISSSPSVEQHAWPCRFSPVSDSHCRESPGDWGAASISARTELNTVPCDVQGDSSHKIDIVLQRDETFGHVQKKCANNKTNAICLVSANMCHLWARGSDSCTAVLFLFFIDSKLLYLS